MKQISLAFWVQLIQLLQWQTLRQPKVQQIETSEDCLSFKLFDNKNY